jgi:hypothetical protein
VPQGEEATKAYSYDINELKYCSKLFGPRMILYTIAPLLSITRIGKSKK